MTNIEERLARIEAHVFGKAEQPKTKERTFESFYVDCTKEQYPEVKRILEAQGYRLYGTEWIKGDDCVTTTDDGCYMTYAMRYDSGCDYDYPTYTLPQLREKFGVEQPQQYVGLADETAEPQVHGIVNTLDEPPKAKTRIEWLNELPDGYRERAVANCKEWEDKSPQDLCDSMGEAILGMCKWKKTPEGQDFWDAAYLHYTKGQLPPLPSGNSEKPNTQEPTAQPIYEAGFWFSGELQCLSLFDGTKLWYLMRRHAWVKEQNFSCNIDPQPHTLTPVETYTVGRFYALSGIEPNHLNDWRSYALCVKNKDVPYFVRPTSEYGIVSIDRIRPSHVSNLEVTPV